MHPLARRRCLAHLTDCAGYLGIAAAMLPAGAVIALRTDLGTRPLYGYLVSAVPPLIATVLAARAESGPQRATRGKRGQGLVVAGPDGRRPGLAAALVRNGVKIFVPWQLGHIATITGITGGFDRNRPLTLVTTVASYGLIAATLASVALGDGRALHDRTAGTVVAEADPPISSRSGDASIPW